MSIPTRGLTPTQVGFLTQPLHQSRVQTANGQAHLTAWDVRRHLLRVFGWGGWDFHVISTDLVSERVACTNPQEADETKRRYRHWVVYRVIGRLTIRDTAGNVLAVFEDGATGDAANQPSAGDAHDMALKTAMSQALKRCAANLGDQFGLGLYNGGRTDAVVIRSLAHEAPEVEAPELPTGPVEAGDDDAHAQRPPALEPAPQEQPPQADPEAGEVADDAAQALAAEALRTRTVDTLRTVYDAARGKGLLNTPVTHPKTENRMPLSVLIQTRKAELLAAQQREQAGTTDPTEGEAA